MSNSNAISTALDSIRSRRSAVESQITALRAEHDKLQTAEQALAELVGTEQYSNGPDAPTLVAAAEVSIDPTPRKREGTSVKAQIVAALEAAGEEGIHRDELGRRFAEVANTTINVTLSNLKSAGRVRSRPADAGRKSIWYFQGDESRKQSRQRRCQLPKLSSTRADMRRSRRRLSPDGMALAWLAFR